ncbi:sensor histidine kinase [Enterococcus sp. AZ194]|uniref:sensor histidine kinase n=1 Tax=Enterococcus sp. AZ194 TaxID=2774629 RepID=UPI003F687B7F
MKQEKLASIVAYPIGFLLIVLTLFIKNANEIEFASHLGLAILLIGCAYIVCFVFQEHVYQSFSYILLSMAGYFISVETYPLIAPLCLIPIYLLFLRLFVPKSRTVIYANFAILCLVVTYMLHIPVVSLYSACVLTLYAHQHQPKKIFLRILIPSFPVIFIECFQIASALTPMILPTQSYNYTFNYTSAYYILVVCLVLYQPIKTTLYRPTLFVLSIVGLTVIGSLAEFILFFNQLITWYLGVSLAVYSGLFCLQFILMRRAASQEEILATFQQSSKSWLPKQRIFYGLKNDIEGFKRQIATEVQTSLSYDALVFGEVETADFTLVITEGQQTLSFISSEPFSRNVSAYRVIGKAIFKMLDDFPNYVDALEQYNVNEHSSSFLEQMNFRKELSYYLHDDVLQDLLAANNMIANLQTEQVAMRELIYGTLSGLNDSIRNQMHELFPSSLGDLSFEQNIAVLVEQMNRRFIDVPTIRIQQTIDKELPEDVAYFFYLSIQELLNNACKHAHASMVIIYLKQTSNTYYLEVQDDGDALPTHFLDAKTSKHLGWTRIQQHIDEFHGTFAIEVLPKGKKFIIQIPRRRDL